MTPEDAIYRYRLRTLALARGIGSVRDARRVIGIHHSAFYRWKSRADSYGPGLLRPRERRRAQMPNSISPLFEQRIVAFASGNPGLGPVRPAAEPQRAEWGGLRVSAAGVRRVLKRHGRSDRARRLALVAGSAAPPGPQRPEPEPERHLSIVPARWCNLIASKSASSPAPGAPCGGTAPSTLLPPTSGPSCT